MRVIARRTLKLFWKKHPTAEQPLKAWYQEVSQATWTGPADIKRSYRHASVLKGSRVVFNIGGNKFRLVVHVNYSVQILYVRFVGTHSTYNQIDAEQI